MCTIDETGGYRKRGKYSCLEGIYSRFRSRFVYRFGVACGCGCFVSRAIGDEAKPNDGQSVHGTSGSNDRL